MVVSGLLCASECVGGCVLWWVGSGKQYFLHNDSG